MDFSYYDIIFIISNIFGTYIIFKFMRIFFDRGETNKKIEMITYISYYFIITVVYLFINIPIVMMICNIISFMGLTFNYHASIKRRIMSVIFIYIILMCIEMIIVFLSGYFDFSIFTENFYSSIWGIISIKIISYFIVLIITNYQNIKRGIAIPTSYWLCICLTPFSSLYCMLILFQSTSLKLSQVLTCVFLLLLINFSAFYLYDVLTATFGDKMEKILLSQQNNFYNKQFDLMRESLKVKKAEKHDLTNHLSVIETLLNKNENEKAIEHIEMMKDDFIPYREFAYSGNLIIDSILNFKIQEAEQNDIKINLELFIPESLTIGSYDMTTILGNLIDNAIGATKKLDTNKNINLLIKYNKGRIIIKMKNPYIGEIKYKNDTIVTSNADKDNHGIGLLNVKSTVEKYNGIMNIEHSANMFSVAILIYV